MKNVIAVGVIAFAGVLECAYGRGIEDAKSVSNTIPGVEQMLDQAAQAVPNMPVVEAETQGGQGDGTSMGRASQEESTQKGKLHNLLPRIERGVFEREKAFRERFRSTLQKLIPKLFPVSGDVSVRVWSLGRKIGLMGRDNCLSSAVLWRYNNVRYGAGVSNGCTQKAPIYFSYVYTRIARPQTKQEFIDVVNALTFLRIQDAEVNPKPWSPHTSELSYFGKSLGLNDNGWTGIFFGRPSGEGDAFSKVDVLYFRDLGGIDLKYFARPLTNLP